MSSISVIRNPNIPYMVNNKLLENLIHKPEYWELRIYIEDQKDYYAGQGKRSLTMDQLAEKSGVSLAKLNRFFKKCEELGILEDAVQE